VLLLLPPWYISRAGPGMGEAVDEFSEQKKQNHEDAIAEVDDLFDKAWFRIFMTFIWTAAAAVMIFYIVQIVQQYQQAVASPSSTINVVEMARLPLPEIVICNWNQYGSVSDPVLPGVCDNCNLTLFSCFYNITTNCTDQWTQVDIQTEGGLFACYQYNHDPNYLIFSNTTGYSGSIATVFSVPILTKAFDDPPQNRLGLQATFATVGTIDGHMIYNEVNFASAGFDTFFALQYINTIQTQLDSDDPEYNTSAYDTTTSQVNLLQTYDPNWNDDINVTLAYIAITIGYQTLSLQQVTFSISYTIINLFGDFSGMIGTLMGLDLIKVCAGLPMFYLAWKIRSVKPLSQAFSG